MRCALLALLPLLSAGIVVAACSGDPASGLAGPDDGTGEGGENPGSDEDDEPGTRDAGAGASRDAGARRDASANKDAGADAAKDAAIDAAPLPCPPDGLPTTACANGLGTTYAAAALPALKFAQSIEHEIDTGGFHHAAWAEQSTTPGIGYMSNVRGSFVLEPIAKPSGLPSEKLRFARLAIDKCGRPTVLYVRSHVPAGSQKYETRIYLASKVTGGWVHEELAVPSSATDATPATDFDAVDLTMDGSDAPVVVTHRYAKSSPVVSRRTASGWTHEHVAFFTSGINLPRVAWSSTFGIVLAYARAGSSKPAIAYKSGATWTEIEVPGSSAIDSFGSNDDGVIAVSAVSDGKVHMAYVNYVGMRRVMRYASIASATAGWTAPVSVPLPYAGLPIPMRVVLGAGLEPRIAFDQFNGAQMHSYVSTMSGGAFSTAKDLGAYSGAGAAIDRNGRMHVFASNYGANGVRQTWHLTQACAP